jgi:hypothetical protein
VRINSPGLIIKRARGLCPGVSHFNRTLLFTLPDTQNANFFGLYTRKAATRFLDNLLKIHRCFFGRFSVVADETVRLV